MNKILIFLCGVGISLAQYSRSSNGYGSPKSQYSGSQNQYKGQEYSEPAKYKFKYDVSSPEAYLDFGHQENRDGDNTKGVYYVLLPDGRKQIVEYTVDAYGYQPKITYEGRSSVQSGQSVNYQAYTSKKSYQGRNQGYQRSQGYQSEQKSY